MLDMLILDGLNKNCYIGNGMLCHHKRQSRHKSPLKDAWSMPSRTMRGSGSPGFRAIRLVPVDAAQI